MSDEPQIELVLGGGAARGFAHIGVLRALEEHDIGIAAIAGTSMGALVGAMTAAGCSSAQLVEILSDRSRIRMLGLGKRGGLFRTKTVIQSFCSVLPGTFEELDIPLTVTTVDLNAGTTVPIRSGRLGLALEAAIAIPGLFSPVEYDGRELIDGGVIDNVPVRCLPPQSNRPIIAVDVGVLRDRPVPGHEGSLWQRAWRVLSGRRRARPLEVLSKAFHIQQAHMTERYLEDRPADVLVRPSLPRDFKIEDFHRHEVAIQAGYDAMRQCFETSPVLKSVVADRRPTGARDAMPR